MTANAAGLQLLCAHHSFEQFKSGNDVADVAAIQFHRRVMERDTDGFQAVVATIGSGTIVGIISVGQASIKPAEAQLAGAPSEELWVWYQLIAIDRRYHNTRVTPQLWAEWLRAGERRILAHPEYSGEALNLVLLPDELVRWAVDYLRTIDFRPVAEDDPIGWWYRRRRVPGVEQ